MAIDLPYTTVALVVAEARLKGHLDKTFTTTDVEGIINEVIVIINNYTDKTIAIPWITTDAEWKLIQQATRIGAAGFLLQQFGNEGEEGERKINLMYKVLKNIVYGEGGTEGGSDTGGYPKGDIYIVGGSYATDDLELIQNLDINQDSSIG